MCHPDAGPVFADAAHFFKGIFPLVCTIFIPPADIMTDWYVRFIIIVSQVIRISAVNPDDTFCVTFDAVKNNIPAEQIKVCTFHTNKFKAYNIAKNKIEITDKSLKTYNFCKNIAHIDKDSLTIDIWHLRACFNKSIKIDSATIGRPAYGQIKRLTINKAKKLGLTGYELQAIIWLTIQKYY